jgi:uroporphyrinogen decarboxylase
MNNRERFLSVLQFEKPDWFPVMEYMGFWNEVVSAWNEQGHNFQTVDEIHEHFGLMRPHYVPINFNFVPPFEVRIIEETDRHITMIDEQGCTKKVEKRSSAMPHYLDFPIKGRRDFEAIRERLNPFDVRYPADWDSLVKQYARRDYPLGLLIRGPFAFCRDFVHFERLMMMVYDDIDLIRDMMNFQVDFTIQLWDKAVREIDVDFVYLGEDMAYKNGPMFSPDILNELVAPLYHKLSDFFKSNGIRNFILDSDGCALKLLPMYIENGITGILPVERAAGMDPVKIRKEYPKLQMIGGVDKLKIAEGGAAIDSEIAKIRGVVKSGGYIPSFDHSVPPIVSYHNYTVYMNKLKDLFVDTDML